MTPPLHAHFAEWDAAYVLGALSPAERRDFEDHLDECERCRSAVSELSALPGLLGRIDDARAFAMLEVGDAQLDGDPIADSEPVDDSPAADRPAPTVDLVTRIRALEGTRRTRRTLVSIGALAAAAVLASVLTVVVPQALAPRNHVDVVALFEAPAGQTAPIDMEVDLSRVKWGTRMSVTCIYHADANGAATWGSAQYSLWVVGVDGSEEPVSSWRSAPGSQVKLEAGTGVSIEDIAHLDLRTADGSKVLLSGNVSAVG